MLDIPYPARKKTSHFFARLLPARPSKISGFLPKSSLKCIGEGLERQVYEIDHNPYYLCKIIKDKAQFDQISRREITAFRNSAWPNTPIPFIAGIIPTEYGKGLLVEKFTSANGDIAPTLNSLVKNRSLPPPILNDLNKFVRHLLKSRVPCHDFKPSNIVYGKSHFRQKLGFYLIDGFGDKKNSHFEELSSKFQKKSIKRRLRKITVGTGLHWSSEKLVFENP